MSEKPPKPEKPKGANVVNLDAFRKKARENKQPEIPEDAGTEFEPAEELKKPENKPAEPTPLNQFIGSSFAEHADAIEDATFALDTFELELDGIRSNPQAGVYTIASKARHMRETNDDIKAIKKGLLMPVFVAANLDRLRKIRPFLQIAITECDNVIRKERNRSTTPEERRTWISWLRRKKESTSNDAEPASPQLLMHYSSLFATLSQLRDEIDKALS